MQAQDTTSPVRSETLAPPAPVIEAMKGHGPTETNAVTAAGSAATQRMINEPQAPPPVIPLSAGGGAMIIAPTVVQFPGDTLHDEDEQGNPKPAGMLTATTLKSTTLPVGTYVEVDPHAKLDGSSAVLCSVQSGFSGKPIQIPVRNLRAQPRLQSSEGFHKPEYASYSGALWNGHPTSSDVRQGSLGDCYLLAAAASLADLNPSLIMGLFSPQSPNAPSYQVRLNRRKADGSGFEPSVQTVDSYLPSVHGNFSLSDEVVNEDKVEHPTYAQVDPPAPKDAGHAPGARVMWPALLEKAYAQMMGGYDAIGHGGWPATALEILTGKPGSAEKTPHAEGPLLDRLRALRKGQVAVSPISVSSKHESNVPVSLRQHERLPGGYILELQLPSDDQAVAQPGDPHVDYQADFNVVPKSLQISVPVLPEGNRSPETAHKVVGDDGNGHLTGPAKEFNTFSYDRGRINIRFLNDQLGGRPDTDHVTASFNWKGMIDKKLHVIANHAYILEDVDANGLIHLKNPHGDERAPEPMSAADFIRLFPQFQSNETSPQPASSK